MHEDLYEYLTQDDHPFYRYIMQCEGVCVVYEGSIRKVAVHACSCTRHRA